MIDNFIRTTLPIIAPPIALMRTGEFPNCAELFEHAARRAGSARQYINLCRLTGLAWVLWAFNAACVCMAFSLLAHSFGTGEELAKPFWHGIAYRQFLAMFFAMLFVGGMTYFIARIVSLNIADTIVPKPGNKRRSTRKTTSPL